jgi:hypothetical protein
MANFPLIKSINLSYYKQLLDYNNVEVIDQVGHLYKIHGFDRYNYLLDINSVFSTHPNFGLKDRTGFCISPLVHAAERPWTVPAHECTLDQALQSRVQDITGRGQMVNLFWSGGIDSTSIVTAFLKHAPDLKQIRIIYSPWSTYEHPEYIDFLKKFIDLELIDQSGEIYLSSNYDGLIISGNTGDEQHASMDDSFLTEYGYDTLNMCWQDFFRKKKSDEGFIEFCEEHFAQAGRPITSVLHARWWFYSIAKLTGILNQNDLAFHSCGPTFFDPNRLIGFFDFDQYENFIYFNLEKILPNSNYASWRQFLKDYCFEFDGFDSWRKNKTKFHSLQLLSYQQKKEILNDKRWLMILDDGTRIHTKSLPLLNRNEWISTYQNSLEYLFNDPGKI